MKLDDLRLFVHVVKHGSFSSASRALDVPAATLTRRIQHLERDLDVKLLVRNARGLSLTNAGKAIWKKSQMSILDLEGLSTEIKDNIHDMEGVVTISAPNSFVTEVLNEFLHPFLRQYPNIGFDIVNDVTDDYTSKIFYEGSVDIAFRFGPQKDSSLIAKKIGKIDVGFFASPQYLKEYGVPSVPADLRKHRILMYRPPEVFSFFHPECSKELMQIIPTIQSDDSGVLLKAAMTGLGIVPLPPLLYQEAIKSGLIVPVLENYKNVDLDIYMVYTSGDYLPRRVRVLVDYISEKWRSKAEGF